MKAILAVVIVAGFLAGCERKAATDRPPAGWRIDGYNDGVITVRHDGNAYKAKCDSSRSFNNADSVTDPKNVHTFPTCDLVIGLVGRSVQPFEGKEKDGNGWTINMWSAGSELALRSWRDEKTPWRQEEFVIISVTKSAP